MRRRREGPPAGRAGGAGLRAAGLRVTALALAALSWAACDFGLVEPPPAAERRARLWLDFRFLGSLGAVTGQVALNPGADGNGRRGVPDERLWWDGAGIDPEPVLGEALLYDVSRHLAGAGPEVRIVPPAVTGLDAAPDTVRVALLAILAPDTLRIVRGLTAELQLAGCCEDALSAGAGFSPLGAAGSWNAVLRPDSAGVVAGLEPVVVTVDGPLRSPLVLAAGVLDPAFAGGSLELTVSMEIGAMADGGLYEVRLWQVATRVVPFLVVEGAEDQGGPAPAAGLPIPDRPR